MIYMKFKTADGYDYIFIGKNKSALMLDTNHGTEFGGEKFIANQELSLVEIINYKNYNQASAAIIAGSPSYLMAIIPPQ